MDTRSKIVDAVPSEARRLKVVMGYFDPMHAGHIRRLNELCRPGERLAVIVADPDEPILPRRARSELVAALRCVEFVIPREEAAGELSDVIDDRPADALRSRDFARHVLSRHNAK